ncbi:MAG: aminotransferase class V-fold PLP-dependent enzyme [Cyanobium sp.]
MPALADKTYFNYGGQGPLPAPSLEAITASWQRIQELGPFTDDVWPYLGGLATNLRGRLARWFGVPPARVAFTENVTSGCVLPLWGLPWDAGDEILLGDAEHPGVVAACQELARRQQLQTSPLPVRDLPGEPADILAALERALTPRTRLVVLSHLLWNTGRILPIEAVAERLAEHPRRPWLLVDAAQSLGSLPLTGSAGVADIYACTGHKWCCGPEGLGAMVLSERVLEEARPTLIGWRSLAEENAGTGAFHRDARRFEVATSCAPLQAGLSCSLELLEAEGDAAARLERIRTRSAQLWQGLQRLPGACTLLQAPPPAGLVSFTLQRADGTTIEPAAIVRALGAQGIWLRSLPDPLCVRACTHLTTSEGEVERLLAALAQLSA